MVSGQPSDENQTSTADAGSITPGMSFGEHLEELRRCLVHALLGVAVMTVITLYFGREIVAILCEPLARSLHAAGLPAVTYNLAVTTGFTIYMKVSLIAGLVLAAPWVMYQIWRFISVGLYPHERRVFLFLLPLSGAMVVLSMMFMYYVLLPLALGFFLNFSASYPAVNATQSTVVDRWALWFADPSAPQLSNHAATTQPGDQATLPAGEVLTLSQIPVLFNDPPAPQTGQLWLKLPEGEIRLFIEGRLRSLTLSTPTLVSPLIEISQYINFVLMLTLGIAIAFQTPVLQVVLAMTGLVRRASLAAYRRHCVFACFVIAAILTPTTDPFNMTILALPLYLLFEFGLILMGLIERKAPGELSDE